jgi:hypothetical protein
MSNDRNKGHGSRSTEQKDSRERRDSRSRSREKAWQQTLTANNIPHNSPPLSRKKVEDKNTGQKLKQWQFENRDGESITIREDRKTTYDNGGTQDRHFNAGPTGSKLNKQHHYYEKKK